MIVCISNAARKLFPAPDEDHGLGSADSWAGPVQDRISLVSSTKPANGAVFESVKAWTVEETEWTTRLSTPRDSVRNRHLQDLLACEKAIKPIVVSQSPFKASSRGIGDSRASSFMRLSKAPDGVHFPGRPSQVAARPLTRVAGLGSFDVITRWTMTDAITHVAR